MNFPYPSQRTPVLADNVLATAQPLAAQAGLQMLQNGGNAVDAALAAAITLTVVEPTGNGIGSDAFAQIWDGRALHGLNGSGKSPANWSPDQFAGCTSVPELGWDTVTVPGAVDAWSTLSDRFGVLPFANLFEAAIRYAEKGFAVTPVIASLWSDAVLRYKGLAEFGSVFLPNGIAPAVGERFVCPQQAKTLAEIAANGGRAFYEGEIAEKIAAHAAATGGKLTLEDLAGHRSQWVQPISCDYQGITLHEIPPNGQGMVALIALGLLEHHNLKRYPMDSADSIHLQVEALKIAFAEALCHIADPSTMTLQPQDLLDESYLRKRSTEIRMGQAQFPQASLSVEKGTVYLAAADKNGMMVSYIQSNYLGFGSGIVVPGTGISLHNRGLGFCLTNGHPNCAAGGKRPFHTIIPGFVTRDGQPALSFGVMGAHMQPQGHVQMVVRIFDYGLNPQAASDAPRWCLTEDMQLALEDGFGEDIAADLAIRGHRIMKDPPTKLFGGAQLILKTEAGYCAASDHRKDGQAVGF